MTDQNTTRDTLDLPKSRLLPALAVVLLCLAGTAGAAFLAQKEVADREATLFARIQDGVGVRTMRAIESYEQRLLGLAGFVAGSEDVTLHGWNRYIAAIQGQDLAPAIWDLGLFDIKQQTSDAGSAVPEDSVVTRFVTLVSGRTIEASGRNLLIDSETAPALRRAMATGEPSLSEIIRNAYRSKVEAGYALVAPTISGQHGAESKPGNLVFLSFSTEQLLEAIMRNIGFPVCVDLYDGDVMSPETLASKYCSEGVKQDQIYYEGVRTVTVGGRYLTLCLTAEQGFYITPLAVPVGVIVPLGLIITLLIGSLLWYEASTRERARKIAQIMTQDLEKSRNRYDRAVRVAGVGFWERDHATGNIIWSDKMWALTGLDPDTDLQPQNILRDIAHPDDRDRVHTAADAHRKAIEPFNQEFRIVRPDGETLWITGTADTDYDSTGNPIRTIGSISDITPQKKEEERRRAKESELTETISELRRSQEKLDAALRDAEAASRAKSTFLSTMSHELRTPLNAILGFSEVIRDNLLGRKSARSYEDYAGDIHSSGEHLLDLINDILDLAKIEEGQITLSPEPTDLSAVIESTLNLMQPRAIAKRHALSAVIGPDSISVFADLRALKQILFNLIANAIQFTDPGGKIEISVAPQDDGTVEICVEDSGVGIAKADIGRVFNPFERVAEPGKPETEGTGLGLAVVKSLVELQNGCVRVDSQPGIGSKFCVYLPSSPPDGLDANPAI